ncbi:unnamed protein product [Paramecium sonneborni]|uniref:Uncharacterized protein n=1 Tax=Paramecium sonneborni TaxID=65129 RepID=A0A8S1PN78_9CILI|nr:unnamed protein product [Paramecium sonneborni]CAD8104472.1 unnamed protein product [Paramecium sonneborni]
MNIGKSQQTGNGQVLMQFILFLVNYLQIQFLLSIYEITLEGEVIVQSQKYIKAPSSNMEIIQQGLSCQHFGLLGDQQSQEQREKSNLNKYFLQQSQQKLQELFKKKLAAKCSQLADALKNRLQNKYYETVAPGKNYNLIQRL